MAAHYQKNKGRNQMLQRFRDRSHKNDNTDTKRLSCITKISKRHCNSQVKPDTDKPVLRGHLWGKEKLVL
jgi:hypothetical protein